MRQQRLMPSFFWKDAFARNRFEQSGAVMKLSELKFQDESWSECATRLGHDARFEGKQLDDNPFPRNGVLRHVWESAWIEVNANLTGAK